ncbi:uncharacterized protein LOC144631134 [Oculina patagonica]
MEAWRYSALNTHFQNLQQKLLSTMQTSKENNSVSVEPMDDDYYNNNITNSKPGVKRRAADDLQSGISQGKYVKNDRPPMWTSNSCLKLDVYTQTDSSFVADNYTKSLCYVSDMVQANNKKLENIEKFLETLGCKIESFLTSDSGKLAKTKKRKADLMTLSHPVAPEADSGMPVPTSNGMSSNKAVVSPRVTNIPAPADSTKSPSMCLSPGLSPYAAHIETPATIHNSVGWSQGFQQGLDGTARQTPQTAPQELQPRLSAALGQGAESATRPVTLEAKLEPLSRGAEREEVEEDEDVLVPVIVSLVDRERKSVTIQVPLKDIINGAPCTLEGLEHVSYSQGCWLGDKTNPLSRVWFCGNPKVLNRSEASGTNPAKLSLNLLEAFFVREEMAASNINGARGRELLDPIKIKGIQVHINYKFPIDPNKEELRWQFLKPRIDSKCRAQRRLQREAQAKLYSPREAGIPERSRSRLPRVDPKEKDQLLYGYSRTADLGLTTPRPQVAVDDFQGPGTDGGENQLSGANGLDQLQANEAIVEIAGIPVNVGEIKE